MKKFKKQIALLLAAVFYFFQTGNAQLSTLKFDVALELDHFVVSNVRDLDGTEDLYAGSYGSGFTLELTQAFIEDGIEGSGYRIPYSPNPAYNQYIYWSRDISEAEVDFLPVYKNGTYRVDKKEMVFKNLSLAQLKNIVLLIGGMKLFDYEGKYFNARPFFCYECGQTESQTTRKVRFNEMSSTQTSINNLLNNGLPQALSFGADKYLELNYYENTKKEDGWVKFKWMVWVTPHN